MIDSGISVVIRSRKGEDIRETVESVEVSSSGYDNVEIIIVSQSEEEKKVMDGRKIFLYSNAKRIEAKLIGVKESRFDKVLFVDSDQIISKNLIQEVMKINYDMAFVPERSLSSGFMPYVMDAKRRVVEGIARRRIDPTIPAVPRVFKREIVYSALISLPDSIIKNVTETEDSIIYYASTKISRNVGWVNGFIFNNDPGLRQFVRKSYSYGYRNESSILESNLPPEYVKLIRDIQFKTLLNNGTLSPAAMMNNLIRGIPYILGTAESRLRRLVK
ncbi:MAG: glycosyltransferase family A protein [Candidatus Parvarchaeota archaeon]